jgi:serine/threonine-protein kinase
MSLFRTIQRVSKVAGVFVALSALGGGARAQAGNATVAQALYDQAKGLMAKGNYVEACPKLEESQRLDPGSGTLINLGDCYEHEGRTASAWSAFLEAAAAAKNVGNTAREHAARDRAAQVVAKLSSIEIDVAPASAAPGLEVVRDGLVVDEPQRNTPIPVDPGTHTISARAEGRVPWSAEVVVKADHQTTTVAIPVLVVATPTAAAAPPSLPPQPVVAPAVVPAPASPPEPVNDAHGGLGAQRTLALVAGGVGVVALGLGTVFGVESKSKHDDADKHCDGAACRDQTGVDLSKDATRDGNIATVGLIVGLAGLGGAAVLWFTGGHSNAPSTRVGLGMGTVSIKGAF